MQKRYERVLKDLSTLSMQAHRAGLNCTCLADKLEMVELKRTIDDARMKLRLQHYHFERASEYNTLVR